MQRFARHGHRYSHAWLSCPLIRSGLELSNPLVFGFFFCFLFHPVFHIIFPLFFCLFFFSPLCFLSRLTYPPGAMQFTDGRYWIYSPRQRRLRTTSLSSRTVSDRAST